MNSPTSPATADRVRPARTSRLRRLGRLARKEIRESLRDRRTLMTLIMMPLIVYPLLGMVVQRFAVARINPKAPDALVLVDQRIPPNEARMMLQALPKESSAVTDAAPTSTASAPESSVPPAGSAGPLQENLQELTQGLLSTQSALTPGIRIESQQYPADQVELAVRSGVVDVGVLLTTANTKKSNSGPQPQTYRILCRAGDAFSERAAAEIEARVRENRDAAIRTLLNSTRFGQDVLFFVRRTSLPPEGPQESPLSAFVPLMLVLMTMTGSVYPAIDLTAGERERGTLEMLMAAPVARGDLLIGKFAAVFLVAVLTAVINLTAMMLTLSATGFDRILLSHGAGPVMLLQVLLLLIVFASFFSAILLSVTSFARSFREAQAWLIPLMLVSLAPGILSLMPGVRLTFLLSFVPLVNIVLLARELFQGIASPGLFLLTMTVTAGYSVAALKLAAQIFGNDALLYSADQRSDIRDSVRPRSTEVSIAIAIKCLAILLPSLIVLSGLRYRFVSPEDTRGQLMLSAGILILLFAIVPTLLLSQARIHLPSAFSIHPFSWRSIPGAILLGLFTWTIAWELLILGSGIQMWQDLLENPAMKKMLERLEGDVPLPLRLLCLALVPAVVEELFFRGVLWNGLQSQGQKWGRTLLLSSAVFAAAHVITDPSISITRLPGTFLLGLMLGLIRLRTGSVIPGMVMHLVNNALLLSLKPLQPWFARLGLDLTVENQAHLPVGLLLLAAVGATLGLYLTGSRNTSAKASPATATPSPR